MTVYNLLMGVTAVQTLPTPVEGASKGSSLPVGSQMADLSVGGALNPVLPPSNQCFHALVVGPSPGATVSATVQPIASNDGLHWVNYGTAITIASGASPGQGTLLGSTPFAFYSAQVTAISGTGAKVSCLMNC